MRSPLNVIRHWIWRESDAEKNLKASQKEVCEQAARLRQAIRSQSYYEQRQLRERWRK